MPAPIWSSAINTETNQSNQVNELLVTHPANVQYEGLYLQQVSPAGNLAAMGATAPIPPNFATNGYTQALSGNTELSVIINAGTDVTEIDRIMVPVSVLSGSGQDIMVSLQTTFFANGVTQPSGQVVGNLVTIPHEFLQSTDALDPTQVADAAGVTSFPDLNVGMCTSTPITTQYGSLIASPLDLTVPTPGNVTKASCFVGDGNSAVIIGGQNGNLATTVNNVWSAVVAGFPTGVGPWSAQNPYPQALENISACVVNGIIVAAGGSNNVPAVVNQVYTAALSSTGTVGNWAQQANYGSGTGNPSSEGITQQYVSLVAVPANTNGSGNLATVFGIGGQDKLDDRPMNQIFAATVDVNGNMSKWSLVGTFARCIAQTTSVYINGWIVVIGGSPASGGDQGFVDHRVYGAQVNLQSGQMVKLGPWMAFPDYPLAKLGSSTNTTYTANGVTDSSAAFTVNKWIGCRVWDSTSAPGIGGGHQTTPASNFATIVSNTATALTTTTWQPVTPPNGRTFLIQTGVFNVSATVVGNTLYCMAGTSDFAASSGAYQGYSLTVTSSGPSSMGWIALNVPNVSFPNTATQGSVGPGPCIIFPGVGNSGGGTGRGFVVNVGNVPYVSVPINATGLTNQFYAVVIQGFASSDLLDTSQIHLCGNANLPTNSSAFGGLCQIRTAASPTWTQGGQYTIGGTNQQHAIGAGATQIVFDGTGPNGYTNGQTIYLGVLGLSANVGQLLESTTLVSGAGTSTWTIAPPTQNAYANSAAWITNAPFHPATSIPFRCYVGTNGRPVHVAEDSGFKWAWLIRKSAIDGRLQAFAEFVVPARAFLSSTNTTYTNTGGTDTSANWITNQWVGFYVIASNSVGFVTANTANTFTVRGWQGSLIPTNALFAFYPAAGGSRSMRVMDSTSETFTGSAGSDMTTDFNGSMQGWGNTAWGITNAAGLVWGE